MCKIFGRSILKYFWAVNILNNICFKKGSKSFEILFGEFQILIGKIRLRKIRLRKILNYPICSSGEYSIKEARALRQAVVHRLKLIESP